MQNIAKNWRKKLPKFGKILLMLAKVAKSSHKVKKFPKIVKNDKTLAKVGKIAWLLMIWWCDLELDHMMTWRQDDKMTRWQNDKMTSPYMWSPFIIIISFTIPILILIWGSEKVCEIPILFFILTTFQLKMDCRYIKSWWCEFMQREEIWWMWILNMHFACKYAYCHGHICI